MEANEFRLGNVIHSKGQSHNDKGEFTGWVNYEIKVDLEVLQNILEKNIDFKYSAIPLNEEWLLKFGFVNSDYDETKFNPANEYADQFKYILESGVFHRQLVCKPIEGWIVRLGDYESQVQIKYVHELQNLFFALKGKELT